MPTRGKQHNLERSDDNESGSDQENDGDEGP